MKYDADKVVNQLFYIISPIASMGYNSSVYGAYTFIFEFSSKLYEEIYLFTPINIMPCLLIISFFLVFPFVLS